MEAATALEVASGSTLKVKEASPADADRPQASPQQEAGSPIPQLLPPIEGDPWRWGEGRLGVGVGRTSCYPDCTSVGFTELKGFRGSERRMQEPLLDPLPCWSPACCSSVCWVFAFYLRSQ